MALERARRREFAQLVADHVFGYQNRYMRRDQVLIGRRSFFSTATSTFFIK
jgi:hypothetical protein